MRESKFFILPHTIVSTVSLHLTKIPWNQQSYQSWNYGILLLHTNLSQRELYFTLLSRKKKFACDSEFLVSHSVTHTIFWQNVVTSTLSPIDQFENCFHGIYLNLKLSTSIYDLVLIYVCHFHHHLVFQQNTKFMLFGQIMDYRDTRAYILHPCIQEFCVTTLLTGMFSRASVSVRPSSLSVI